MIDQAYDAAKATPLSVGHLARTTIVECGPRTTVAEAARRMNESHCGSIIIVDQGKAIGIWTARDAIKLALDDPAILDSPISLHMSSPVKSIRDSESIQALTFRFDGDGVRHLLVVDDFGNRIGIVSQTDVVNNQGIEFFVQMRDVGSVMRKAPLTVTSDLSVAKTVGMMAHFKQDAVVVDHHGEYGIFTESDVLKLVGEGSLQANMRSIASFPLYTLTVQTSLYKARSLFAAHQVRHLGVMDGSILVGLLTYADILVSVEQAYVRELQQALGAQALELLSSRRSIALAQKVAESTFQGIIITGAGGEIESVNPAFTAITGYAPSEVIGRNPRLLKSGRHDVEFYREMYLALSRHGVWTGEVWNRRKNGELYPSQLTISAVRSDSGEVVNHVGVFADLTEGHRHQDELRQVRRKLEEQEDIHRLMIDTLPINAFIKDARGRYLAVNNRAAEYYGFAKEELIGRSDFEIFSPELAATLRADDSEARRTGTPMAKEICIKRQGTERYLLVNKRAIEVQGEQLIIGASVDITDRKQMERRLDDERAILTMIARGAELRETLDAICVRVERHLHGGIASIMCLDDAGKRLLLGAAPGLPPSYSSAVDGLEIGPEAGSCGTAAFTRNTVIVDDIADDRRWDDYRELALSHGLRACWSLPIFAANKTVLGSFAIYYRSPRQPDEFEMDLIDFAGSLAAIALERAKDTERLHRLATVDSLTNIANRRHFLSLGEHEVARVNRFGQPLALLMIDIDHFKRINDAHGHAVGDAVLRQVAETFQRAMRAIDVAGRLGGEEFAALLPETDAAAARNVAERLRADVANASFEVGQQVNLSVTISLGVGVLKPGETLGQLLIRADQALYAAKNAGRNRVEFADT